MHHGISEQIDPGEMVPEHSDLDYVQTLPVRWSKSIDAFENGTNLPRYFGAEYHRLYAACQRDHSDQFNAEVSNRDYEWYLRAI